LSKLLTLHEFRKHAPHRSWSITAYETPVQVLLDWLH